MQRSASILLATVLALSAGWRSFADEVHFYEENGLTYRETVRTVQRPIVQTEWQQREQTVYRRQLKAQPRDTLRTFSTPVTQHEWITRMHGRWNPFATPYFTHHLVPVTRWEQRAEIVQVPVLQAEWVPEKRVVSVPVSAHRLAEEKVVERVAVGPASTPSSSPRTAMRPTTTSQAIGGTALDGDPPRQGLRWRPPDSVLR